MLWKGLEHTGPSPAACGRLGRQRGERGGIEGVAGQWTGEVRVAPGQPGVERGRAGHVLFDHQLTEFGRAGVQSFRRRRPASIDGVAATVAQGHEAVVAGHVGDVEV